jgi:hypothetical protein
MYNSFILKTPSDSGYKHSRKVSLEQIRKVDLKMIPNQKHSQKYCHIYVTTSNYSATANSHAPQLTTACTKSFQSAVSSPVVAW